MIFYFHGFASSGISWKIQELKKYLQKETIVAPTLPVDPAQVVTLFEHVMKEKGTPRLLIGSSLGGFYALYASARFAIPAVLINPSTTPWLTLESYVGINKRYYTNEPFEWKSEYLETLKALKTEIDGMGPRGQLLCFFLSSDDEVLDHSNLPKEFPEAGLIRFYDRCGHSFTRFKEIIPEIERLIK